MFNKIIFKTITLGQFKISIDCDLLKSVINKCTRLFIVLKSFKVMQLVSPAVTRKYLRAKKYKCLLSSNNSDTMDMSQGQMCDLNLQVHKNAKLTDDAFSNGLS